MKVLVILILNFFLTFQALSDENNWSWVLKTPKSRYLAGEPIPVSVEMRNTGSNASEFPYSYRGPLFYLDSSKKLCEPSDLPKVGQAVAELSSVNERISDKLLEKPGSTHQIDAFVTTMCDLRIANNDLIGKHQICAVAPLANRTSCIDFEIVVPTGVDYQVYKNFPLELRDIQHDLRLVRNINIVKDFPTSTYAAWLIVRDWGTPEKFPPDLIRRAIESGDFPHPNKIPEYNSASPMELRTMNTRELAQYQISSAQSILNQHPDFALSMRLKLIIGINSIALGQKEVGISTLKELASAAQSRESWWSKEFLALYGEKID